MKSAALGLAVCLAVGLSGSCWAQDLKATEKHTDTVLGFETGSSYSNFNLTVTGPNGFHASAASKQTAPSLDLRRSGALAAHPPAVCFHSARRSITVSASASTAEASMSANAAS